MYRDDSDAARARVESLETELRQANAELASIKARGLCRVAEHAQLAARLEELTTAVDAQRDQLGRQVSPHAKQEEELMRLQFELSDLELLASDSTVMEQKLAECERAIESLSATRDNTKASLTVPAGPSGEDLVWVPRRGPLRNAARWLTTLGAAASGAMIAIAAGGGAIALGAVLLAVGGAVLGIRKEREDTLLDAQANAVAVRGVRWADVQTIRFERDPARMILELPRARTMVVRATDVGYGHILGHARAAVELYGIAVHGGFPKLLAGAT